MLKRQKTDVFVDLQLLNFVLESSLVMFDLDVVVVVSMVVLAAALFVVDCEWETFVAFGGVVVQMVEEEAKMADLETLLKVCLEHTKYMYERRINIK